MDSTDIQKALYLLFWRHEYHLRNSFVFSWECDFFCMSQSGYFIEVEIKISRSDFFRDFIKDKHKFFSAVKSGKKFIVRQLGCSNNGDLLIRHFPIAKPIVRGGYGTQINNGSEELIEANFISSTDPNFTRRRYIVNDWQDRLCFRMSWRDIHARATNIHFVDVSKVTMPNQFYYAIPQGLVDLSEIPEYAGLITIDNGAATIVRRAPYIHKRKLDLSRQLLKKYYQLWKYKGNYKSEMNSDIKTENDGTEL